LFLFLFCFLTLFDFKNATFRSWRIEFLLYSIKIDWLLLLIQKYDFSVLFSTIPWINWNKYFNEKWEENSKGPFVQFTRNNFCCVALGVWVALTLWDSRDEFITLFLSLCSSHSERNNSEMESNEFEPLHVRVVRQVCTTIQFLLDKVYRQTSNGTLHSEENIKDDTLTTKQLNECLEVWYIKLKNTFTSSFLLFSSYLLFQILFNSPSQLLDALSYIAHKQIQILQNSSEEKTLSLVG
jgi:hypothetical protein